MTNSTDLLTPNGTYIIMNAATHTYLNVLNYGGPGTAIVCSVGNDLGNDIWNYMTTQNHDVTLQNFGTAGFAAVDVNRAITNSIAPQWNMIRSGLYKYAFHIQDATTGKCMRVDKSDNGAPVTLVPLNDKDANQTWFFVGRAPV